MTAASITVKTLADSITDGGDRLTTFEWTYPRYLHSEILTHGMLRRNSASSRAIPTKTLRARVCAAPAYPGSWGQNQKGMQADHEVVDTARAEAWWLRGRDMMAAHHEEGERLGLHKQVVNRVIEPWMMITIIISATDWANFFHLRKHKDAEPSFQKLAALAWGAYHENMPIYRPRGDWHLPLIDDETRAAVRSSQEFAAFLDGNDAAPFAVWTDNDLKKISTGRCARVSYLTHDGERNVAEDIALHDRLIAAAAEGGPMHMSPFEHPCMAVGNGQKYGPFTGWLQYRKTFENEAGPSTADKCHACGCWGGRHSRGCGIGRAIAAGEIPPSLDLARRRA